MAVNDASSKIGEISKEKNEKCDWWPQLAFLAI